MKKIYLAAFLVIIISHIAYAKQLPARYHLLMDRDWKFFLGDDKNASGVRFDDNSWRVLDLPHDWSIEGEFNKDAPTRGGGGYLPTGVAWYRKQFTLPSSVKGKQVSIQFDGVYMNSEVWVNNHYLGKRPNGYISFVYDLTPYLVAGKNLIAVRVDNSEQPNSRWYSGSGIYRNVWLNITSPLHIAQWGTYITTPDVSPASAAVAIRTKIENNGEDISNAILTSTIIDADGHIVSSEKALVSLKSKTNSEYSQQIKVDSPWLWSVESPYLYTMHSVIRSGKKIIDEQTSTFGIRKLEYSAANGFLLNGKRVKMNGVCLHHDGGCVGAAVPIKIWETRLKLLKDMGCNAIRTSHNPVAPEFLDLCDKMGFLVMDEAFDVWESGKVKYDYHIHFDDWAQIDLNDQIHRDRNHPSVVLWSAGNEIPDQGKDKGISLLKDLLTTFHREDPTRPVTTANDGIAADSNATKLAFLQEEDIVGYNYVDRWHERRELFYSLDHYDHPEWKMIGTESEALRNPPEYSLGKDSTIRPNYLSGMIRAEQLWKFVAVHDYVIGDFMWTGVDYLGEARWPARSSGSGQINTMNQPKDGYYFYQSQWQNFPMVHLLPKWTWPGREGQIIPVVVYTNCDTVELFVNGKSYGIKVQEFPRQGNSYTWIRYAKPYVGITTGDLHLTWDIPYQPGTIKAVGRKWGIPMAASDQIVTTGKAVSLGTIMNSDTVTADGRDVCLVTIRVLDAHGNYVPDADNMLHISVTGNGKLLGLDNGDERDDTSFKNDRRKLFNGNAYAVIQAGRGTGDIRLTLESDGMQTFQTDISTKKVRSNITEFEDLK